jgi:hypothetical protein
VLSGALPREVNPLVLCGVQIDEAPQYGPLKLMLGVDPKAARREARYRARMRVLGSSFCHLNE